MGFLRLIKSDVALTLALPEMGDADAGSCGASLPELTSE